ncbi:MAG: hypothetical protein HYS33_00230 [Acidobacteria bacterium]|nr:hypothetical protein [Acidobacteriota bacterium]
MDECNRIKVNLLFPLFDNDGKPFDESVWDWWLSELTRIVAGFTDMGVVSGWWHGHSDLNRWIVIVASKDAPLDQIRRFLHEARSQFRQEKMYLDYHPVFFEEVD